MTPPRVEDITSPTRRDNTEAVDMEMSDDDDEKPAPIDGSLTACCLLNLIVRCVICDVSDFADSLNFSPSSDVDAAPQASPINVTFARAGSISHSNSQ